MPMPISMLDCPEHNHTSPIITSSNWTLVEPLTAKVYGPPAFMADRTAFHSPRSLAWTCWLPVESVTVIFSFGSAQPQTTSGFSCCKTIWLENTFGNRPSARATCVKPPPATSPSITVHTAQPSLVLRIIISVQTIACLSAALGHTQSFPGAGPVFGTHPAPVNHYIRPCGISTLPLPRVGAKLEDKRFSARRDFPKP